MPKIVDHEQRRREIAEAVYRIAAADGVAAVSMRRVATELGLSLGAVQHYFASRDEMLDFASSDLGRRRERRVRRGLLRLGRFPRERDILRLPAEAGPPLDEERRLECLAEAAFLGRMISGDATGREGIRTLLGFFESLLRAAEDRGALAPDVDPKLEARMLWAILSSQAQGVLAGIAEPDEVVAGLDYWFDRVLPQR